VLSLVQESDFVFQRGPYSNLNEAKTFKRLLLEKVKQEGGKYFFPQKVKKNLFSKKISQIADFIHEFGFENKASLSKEQRVCFIEGFYFLLMLQLVATQNPSSFSFTCKDAVDHGMVRSFLFYLGVMMLVELKSITFKEIKGMWSQMLSSSILIRERMTSPQTYENCLQAAEFFQGIGLKLQGDNKLKNKYFKSLSLILGVDCKKISLGKRA
ncbi:hypothetical protein AB751O23_AZ_00100, partial [Chlamydiales bacterium SCGC AB-751-O23]